LMMKLRSKKTKSARSEWVIPWIVTARHRARQSGTKVLAYLRCLTAGDTLLSGPFLLFRPHNFCNCIFIFYYSVSAFSKKGKLLSLHFISSSEWVEQAEQRHIEATWVDR
jgi:hypothetical protein